MTNLLERNFKIVEKKKIWFAVAAAVIVFAVVMMIIYGKSYGAALNLGMDFEGGYTINVNVGANLDEDTKEDYKSVVKKVVDEYVYTDENGVEYNVKVSDILITGSGTDTSLYIKYKAVADEDLMDVINADLVKVLNNYVNRIIPVVTKNGSVATATYAQTVNLYKDILKNKLTAAGLDADTLEYVDNATIKFDAATLTVDEIKDIIYINDTFVGHAVMGDLVSATVSDDLLYNAISAVTIALVLMLIYIAFRFEFMSGVSAVISLLHDVVIMFAFMIIFRVEFNSTFIAALITILGYSINNSILIFDSVRSSVKIAGSKYDPSEIANNAIRDTFYRSIYATLTTLIMILSVLIVCALGNVEDMVTFAMPIIAGLVAGTFSSMFLAPSLWTLLKGRQMKVADARK